MWKQDRGIKYQIRVVLRPVLLFLFTVLKTHLLREWNRKGKEREEKPPSPATNNSQDSLMMKLRRTPHDV